MTVYDTELHIFVCLAFTCSFKTDYKTPESFLLSIALLTIFSI